MKYFICFNKERKIKVYLTFSLVHFQCSLLCFYSQKKTKTTTTEYTQIKKAYGLNFYLNLLFIQSNRMIRCFTQGLYRQPPSPFFFFFGGGGGWGQNSGTFPNQKNGFWKDFGASEIHYIGQNTSFIQKNPLTLIHPLSLQHFQWSSICSYTDCKLLCFPVFMLSFKPSIASHTHTEKHTHRNTHTHTHRCTHTHAHIHRCMQTQTHTVVFDCCVYKCFSLGRNLSKFIKTVGLELLVIFFAETSVLFLMTSTLFWRSQQHVKN